MYLIQLTGNLKFLIQIIKINNKKIILKNTLKLLNSIIVFQKMSSKYNSR